MIMVVGDTHGRFKHFNNLIQTEKPEIVLQVGDFGYWPRWADYRIKDLKNELTGTRIYFCDGNHEDHWALKELKSFKDREIKKDVFYMKRGEVLSLPDGRKVLFMGGAASIDKSMRRFGIDWFPEEMITSMDIENLPDVDIDIVISHTCPTEFKNELLCIMDKNFYDPSEQALSYVLDKYMPKQWFFGHFHAVQQGIYKDKCRWRMLSMLDNKGWWYFL